MNCPNCGKESVEGAKFCESCGAPLVSEVSEPAAPVPPAPASPVDARRHQHGTVERAAGSCSNAIGLCALRAARAAIRHPKRLCCPQCQYAAGLLHPARSLATKPLPECIPSTVWPACVPRRIRWRDLPNVRFRSHIAPHQLHPLPCFDHHLRPFDYPSRMDASHDDHQLGNLQGQEAQHHRVWRVYAPVREPYWRHLAFVLAQRPIAAAPQQSSNNPKFNLKKMARNGPFFFICGCRARAFACRRNTKADRYAGNLKKRIRQPVS